VPPKSVQALLNTPVVLHLRGGTQLQGVLVSVLTYEFVVKTGDNTYLIVMKHGVDMLEPAVTA
jgi:sRNA-binding regulator protein Hfq